MSDFLKELNAINVTQKPKVHTVNIQGQNIVVTLEKKLEVMKHGADAYMWKSPTEFVLKPKPIAKASYPVLKKTSKGYLFKDNDIHWPNAVADGGETWQR